MCEFKIGDVVRRIISDNSPYARIGTIATVVDVPDDRVMHVSYFGAAKELWFQDRAELVERKLEQRAVPSPYQFKVAHTFAVGDKGKCRDGTPYEVVAVGVKGLKFRRTMAVTREGYVYGFLSDGTSGNSSAWDLMPPTKTVWRVELTGVKSPGTSGLLDMTSTRYYDTEENARRGIARGINNYITVKGPFPEEREA